MLIEGAATALRVAFTIAVVALVAVRVFIFRRCHQFSIAIRIWRTMSRSSGINREEEMILVWIGITLVLLFILYQARGAGAK
jgi:uncharacterized membrane protein